MPDPLAPRAVLAAKGVLNIPARPFLGVSGEDKAQQGIDDVVGAARGRVWEEAIAAHLAQRGIPVESVPGGYRVLGFLSLSGLMRRFPVQTRSCLRNGKPIAAAFRRMSFFASRRQQTACHQQRTEL